MLQEFDERNAEIVINVGGQLLPREEAKVSVFDSLVQGGDGCWEGLRLYDGRIFKLEEHLARLRHSALAMAFVEIPTRGELVTEIRRSLQANGRLGGGHISLTPPRGTKDRAGRAPGP